LSLQISSQEQTLGALVRRCNEALSAVEQQAKNPQQLRESYQQVFKNFSQLKNYPKVWNSIYERCKLYYSDFVTRLQRQAHPQHFLQPPANSAPIQSAVPYHNTHGQGATNAMVVDSVIGSPPGVQPVTTFPVVPALPQAALALPELPPQIQRVGQRYFSLDGRELELPSDPNYQTGYVWVVKASAKKDYEVLFDGHLIPMKDLRVSFTRFNRTKEGPYILCAKQRYGPEGVIHYSRSLESVGHERRMEAGARI
jgi:hypothetical protein